MQSMFSEEIYLRRQKLGAKETCEICNLDLSQKNAKYRFEEKTNFGYETKIFCTRDCLIKFIKNKFGRHLHETT